MGLECGYVRAAAGLGDGQRRDALAGQYAWHDFTLDVIACQRQDRRQSNAVRKQAGQHAARGGVARQRARERDAQAVRYGRAAIALRVTQAEEAQLGRALIEPARKLARCIPRGDMGRNFGTRETLGGLGQCGAHFLQLACGQHSGGFGR
ncbi:hypothetical protein D3C72_1420220 [compost metagenome]